MTEKIREGKLAHSQRQAPTHEAIIDPPTLSPAAEEAIMRIARLIGRQIAREQFEIQMNELRHKDKSTPTNVEPPTDDGES
jgi:hypothetical protein